MAADSCPLAVDEHTFAVDQVRLGDHAFAHYANDDLRWEVAAVFAVQGLARGEKVVIIADSAVPAARALRHLAANTGAHETALASGQLVFTTMQAFVGSGHAFTAELQLRRISEEKKRARRAGFAGLRAFIDMAWANGQDIDHAAIMHRETHAGEVFVDGRYAEICSYDRRVFPAEVVEAMRAEHPVALLERPGELCAFSSADGVHFVGEADLATREFFRTTLLTALSGAPDRGTVLVDLSRLCFLSAGCAGDLLGVAAQVGDRERVVVRCSAHQARTLQRLGAAQISWLVLAEQTAGR